MTNINCSENCCYQKEGKCCLDKVTAQPIANTKKQPSCAYFKEAN